MRNDQVAERSKALASGASSKERRFESCPGQTFEALSMIAPPQFSCTTVYIPQLNSYEYGQYSYLLLKVL